MANFIADLGTMVQNALRADATVQEIVGKSGPNAHVEFGDQPLHFPQAASGRCYIRWAGLETFASYGQSADSAFTYLCAFDIVDVQGRKQALTKVAKAMHNAFADRGAAALGTHLQDTGNNRLGGSGEVAFDLSVDPRDALPDLDRPVVAVMVTIRLTHKLPLE